MNTVELVLILLAASVVLAIAAQRIKLPYPIVLVLGGGVLAFTPLPRLEINPDVVLVVFLPPLLYSAAWLTSWQDFRAELRTIVLLAVGLVIATTAGVAAVAHLLVPGISWAVAFVLGAIVSPPDAVAATSVMQRMRVPHRLVTILEGESLVNDATGLVVYQIALAAVAGTSVSASHAVMRFAVVSVGGAVVGLVVGWLVARVHRRLDDFTIEAAISLLTPYIAYIPAEHLGVSGVLSAVTAGGYIGWRSHRLLSPTTRLRTRSVWAAVLFVFNGLVFVLMGLELAGTHRLFRSLSASGLVLWCAAIAGATIAIRLIWVPLALHVPHRIVRRWRKEPHASWKDTAIISWTAMRGIVSLALALGLPDDFPYRDLIVLFVFVVIAVTLIGQGLTLPLVIRAARFDNVNDHRQTREALLKANTDALARLDEVAAALQTPPRVTEIVRTIYTRRCERLRATSDESAEGGSDGGRALRALRAQLIEVERAAIVELRDHGTISEEILQRLQNDLDLEALQPAR